MNKPKVALVYDRVNKFGGAERVLLDLHQIYPEAPLYTLVYNPQTAPWAKAFQVRPTFVDKIPYFRTRHEILAPITPLAFESLNFDEYDVVISITSADAKSIITKPHTLHICYCLTPTRYLWSGFEEYKNDWKMKLIPSTLIHHLQTTDKLTSNRPDYYLSISKEIQKRLQDFYQQESNIIYPAIEDKFFAKPTNKTRAGYLLVSRLVPYKKAELVVRTFNRLKKPLTIIGTGKQETYLKSIAKPNIVFKGLVTDKVLIDAYQKALAIIFPQAEDFGLVPLEAQACGTPVIAYAQGGALETVVDGKTGIFFNEQTEESLKLAIEKFEQNIHISSKNCVMQAQKFNFDRFANNFRDTVESLWKRYKNIYM